MASASRHTCPSAQPGMIDAEAIGVIAGSAAAPEIAYLKADAGIGPATLPDLGGLDPTLVFRFAARCEEGRCAQFAGGRCSLGARIVAQLPEVVAALPSCRIRATCRWYAEQGAASCRRCPQVTTLVSPDQAALAGAARVPD